ncbi:MAG: sarcosine oxidase subunit gamma [Alphaproteobacteria bacterium]|nr:sarcosine oxidase subunit gamma [Alphaproteobacteria bacterium]
MAEVRGIDGLSLTILRGGGTDFHAAVAGALGPGLPETPNRAAGGALWLGPDEWLVVSDADPAGALEAALDGQHCAIVDVSEARAVLELSGPDATDVLASGCRLDFGALTPGSCAQTALARANVLLEPREGGVWRLYVGRSYAAYARAWLEDAIALQATSAPP